ncbi:UNKNOWN [Stylonychia lemnae]|uniref:Transmembrane protein n=1 Tax=Stylonychia lemnae TaxID=5949 RepID=A0A078AT61_STYLE|nr:UNKNOWN [Stylonychia lemnae]|eukprot:CDW84063.1 UNKNOWN [Stylonychia lemnae]
MKVVFKQYIMRNLQKTLLSLVILAAVLATFVQCEISQQCQNSIIGCHECQIQTYNEITSIQCLSCIAGMFLISSRNSVNQETLCTFDCKSTHSSMIKDTIKAKCICELQIMKVVVNEILLGCGLGCQSCNVITGCEICPGEISNSGWVVSALNDYQDSSNSNFQICQKSQGEICIHAESYEDCLTCKYSYGQYTDTIGNRICQTLPIRCNFTFDVNTNLPIQEQITACEDGYVDQLTGKCTANCGIGRYGSISFNQRGYIETSTCQTCDDSCFECAGLTIEDPLFSLQHAISKAYEYGAPFKSAKITILLISGKVHSMLRYDENHFLYQAYDQNSQSTKIIIDTTDATLVTVNYKLRDQFKFMVGAGLVINNIAFDAIDSILDQRQGLNLSLINDEEYICLNDPFQNCCKVVYNSATNIATIDGKSFCQFKYPPNDECQLPIGTSFIQFDISSQTLLQSPQTLQLNNVEFNNFIYDFNTLIELNDFGGFIEMNSVLINNISSCGAIIRNKRFDQIYENLLQKNGFLSLDLLHSIQFEQSQLPEENIFSTFCGDSNSQLEQRCFGIMISGTIVNNYNKLSNFSKVPLWVNEKLKMKHFGLVLDLENFQGHIKLENSLFNTIMAVHPSNDYGISLHNNVPLIKDSYSNYGDKSSIQIKSTISIVNHGDYQVNLINNNFQLNAATKGMLYFDMNYNRESVNKLQIVGNFFINNFGFIMSNAIFIRARGTQQVDVYSNSNQDDSYCTGYQINQNYYNNNVGLFAVSGGSVYLECVNYQQEDNEPNGRIFLPEQTINQQEDHTLNDNLHEDYSLSIVENTFDSNTAADGLGILNVINFPSVLINFIFFTKNTEAIQESLSNIATSLNANSIRHIIKRCYSKCQNNRFEN